MKEGEGLLRRKCGQPFFAPDVLIPMMPYFTAGKEANVYHATGGAESPHADLAIKVYKTSILVFKDRDRCAVQYVIASSAATHGHLFTLYTRGHAIASILSGGGVYLHIREPNTCIYPLSV